MNRKVSDNVWNILSCPYCGTSLKGSSKNIICSTCQSHYRHTESGAIDLRLPRQKKYKFEFSLGTRLLPESGFEFDSLPEKSYPDVDFTTHDVPQHLSREILSYFPKAKTDSSLMLDLGCGNMVHQDICEHAGFEYVGLDYESNNSLILGDAHALPFKDEGFEFILSIAVLEHIRFPFIAMKEAHRVLKSNGVFIGTVAFLEPFHDNSFYHHTHLGTYNSLQEGGFRIDKICPSTKWPVLMAQACLGLFPKMPCILSRSLILPLQFIHRFWWRMGGLISKRATEKVRIRNTTGSITFIARK